MIVASYGRLHDSSRQDRCWRLFYHWRTEPCCRTGLSASRDLPLKLSVSNHLAASRDRFGHRSSASQASRLCRSGLRPSTGGSPDDPAESSLSFYGLLLRLGLLPTPPHDDAVTLIGRPRMDLHLPDKARSRTHGARPAPAITREAHARQTSHCFGGLAYGTERSESYERETTAQAELTGGQHEFAAPRPCGAGALPPQLPGLHAGDCVVQDLPRSPRPPRCATASPARPQQCRGDRHRRRYSAPIMYSIALSTTAPAWLRSAGA